jgi:hypothetical protein
MPDLPEKPPRKPVNPVVCMGVGAFLVLVTLLMLQTGFGGAIFCGVLWLAFFRWSGYRSSGSPKTLQHQGDHYCTNCGHPLSVHSKWGCCFEYGTAMACSCSTTT